MPSGIALGQKRTAAPRRCRCRRVAEELFPALVRRSGSTNIDSVELERFLRALSDLSEELHICRAGPIASSGHPRRARFPSLADGLYHYHYHYYYKYDCATRKIDSTIERFLSMAANGGYMDNSPNPAVGPMGGRQSQTPSPGPQHGMGPANGVGGGGSVLPNAATNAGHQMDLHHLYEMVVELGEVLKHNREMTRGIVKSAEEIMRRATDEGTNPTLQQMSGELTAARIAELEHALAKERRTVEALKREQEENIKLLREYEDTVGVMLEQIRNYCQNINMQFLAQKRHYNNLLQAERDAHLQSRLDRDAWHAKTMRCAELIREAYRIRCEEDDLPIRIISGLQNEVRAYRQALGLEPEKPEEETGWLFLKDLPPTVD
ncbi:hypothetical protein VTN31DRAFT_1791 [Thermomyces dupontii]|uniref:uncharacterized protein n=1 Tax=Talaromyces thermophilus TaxID=28565 RepID=UPI003742B097